MMDHPTLIIADPDVQVRTAIATLLTDSFCIHHAESLQSAYHLLRRPSPTMLILGLEQPDGDGLTFIAALREEWQREVVFITCLSTRDDIMSKVTATRFGADDYVVKPRHTTAWYSYHLRLMWRIHCLSATPTS